MRKPRDFDAELRALEARTTALKARKIAQFGELVIATGANGLEVEVLAGALLAAMAATADRQLEWRLRGAVFFRNGAVRGDPGGALGDRAPTRHRVGPETAG